MRTFLCSFAVFALTASTAIAETQSTKQARLRYALTSSGMATARANQLLVGFANVLYYDTYVELAAATPTEGTFGWAIDTNAMYYYTGAAWVSLIAADAASIAGENDGTISNGVNNAWTFAENDEDLVLTFAANLVTISSGTSATFAFTPAVAFTGDVALNGGASALTFGAGSSSIVLPDDSATALLIGSGGMLGLITIDSTDDHEEVNIVGTTATSAFRVDTGFATFDEQAVLTAGASFGAALSSSVTAADVLTLTGAAPTVTIKDNAAAALTIKSSGAASLLILDTLTDHEEVNINGTTATSAFRVDTGFATFDEQAVLPAGASFGAALTSSVTGADVLTLTGAAPTMTLKDNEGAAFLIKSSGAAALATFDTTTDGEKLKLTGTAAAPALHVDVGTSQFDENVTIGDGTDGEDFALGFNGHENDGSITYMEDEDRFDFDNEVQVGDILTVAGGAGALTLSSGDASFVLPDADASALDIGSAGRTDLLRFDTTNDAEKMIVTGHTGDVAFDVPVGQASFTEGVDMALPAMALAEIRFCFNGPNGNTPMYGGPVLSSDMDTDMGFGGAACDANDSETETTADDDPIVFAHKPVAMVCKFAAGGTNDEVSFQLREDQSDVTGLTCNVTMDGAAAKQCVVRLPAPELVAAGSLLDIKMVATDDNLTAVDGECRVYTTF
jgi:hypothetical protein